MSVHLRRTIRAPSVVRILRLDGDAQVLAGIALTPREIITIARDHLSRRSLDDLYRELYPGSPPRQAIITIAAAGLLALLGLGAALILTLTGVIGPAHGGGQPPGPGRPPLAAPPATRPPATTRAPASTIRPSTTAVVTATSREPPAVAAPAPAPASRTPSPASPTIALPVMTELPRPSVPSTTGRRSPPTTTRSPPTTTPRRERHLIDLHLHLGPVRLDLELP